MPHTRERHLAPLLQKSLKYWPVVCLLGARQVGKSTFLKQLQGYRYSTLDDPGLHELAQRNPQSVLIPPCIIDEAQKAPMLFDAVKRDVDERKTPGKFILTGSVRFTKRSLIRESLTGRTKMIQLHPFMCSEALELRFEDRWSNSSIQKVAVRVARADLEKTLSRGGMPAIFAARSRAEVSSYWKSLIDSYVYRDLLYAIPRNARPTLALKILKSIAEILALGETPTFSRILRKTGGARTQVERHLIGLEDLMVVHRVPHLGASAAKDMFLPFDSALFLELLELDDARADVAVHLGCLRIRLIGEFLAVQQITDSHQSAAYLESPRGQRVDLVTKTRKGGYALYQIHEEPVPHDYDLRFLRAQAAKQQARAIALTSIDHSQSLPGVSLLPWEQML
jgi:predicted AAA+ superfamily ATPase